MSGLPKRRIGDVVVSAVGLGCMPLSDPPMLEHRDRAIATIHHALDVGITLIDTADIYAPDWQSVGHNEELVAEALRTYTGPADVAGVLVATKGGLTRSEGEHWGRDSSPEGLRRSAEASVRALGVTSIDLYQHHRTDPALTYLEQVHALRAIQQSGLARRIGLSNVTLAELDLALDELGGPGDGGIVSVQNEFSPRFRADAEVIGRCGEVGLAFLPWSPLGGAAQAHDVGGRYAAFAEVGDEIGASAQETVIAWLLKLSPVIIPIPGATRPATIDSTVRATTVGLSDDQFERLQESVPEGTSMFPDDLPRSPLR